MARGAAEIADWLRQPADRRPRPPAEG